MRAPIELVDRKPFALCRIEHRKIPRQDIAAQSASFGDQRIQEIADRLGKSVACAVRHEPHPAVDVPAHDEERPAGACERIAYRAEILFAVDQECDLVRVLDPPAIAA